jgi:hypothetical protein
MSPMSSAGSDGNVEGADTEGTDGQVNLDDEDTALSTAHLKVLLHSLELSYFVNLLDFGNFCLKFSVFVYVGIQHFWVLIVSKFPLHFHYKF